MVLIRALCALAVLAAGGGCGQSLFDANGERSGGDDGGGDDGGGDDGPPVPRTCPDTCLADAAADFDQTSSRVRYVEEGPGYMWPDMTSTTGVSERVGRNDGKNIIRRCADAPLTPACRELPDALLVTPAGETSSFFPAIEFRSTSAQVLHLIVRAYVPSDSEQNIRIYRNSLEDALVTARGVKGGLVERDVIVDALPDDRFLVAVEPTGTTAGSAALQFFVSSMGESFPSTCQFAASFEAANVNVVPDLCNKGRDLTSMTGAGTEVAPSFISNGPFPEQRRAISLPLGRYLQAPNSSPIARAGSPLTIQFWVQVTDAPTGSDEGWAFSDLDIDDGGGSGVSFFGGAGPTIQVQGAKEVTPGVTIDARDAPFSTNQWRFVRMIVTTNTIEWCINGRRMTALPVAPARPETKYALHLGKREFQNSALFEGALDDVRVFSAALTCD